MRSKLLGFSSQPQKWPKPDWIWIHVSVNRPLESGLSKADSGHLHRFDSESTSNLNMRFRIQSQF